MRMIRLDAARIMTVVAIVFVMKTGANGASADTLALNLRAVFTGGPAKGSSLEIALFRWPADADRAPLVAAFLAPPRQSAAPAVAAPAGRGGRGGRGAAPPSSPMARLDAAIKAAPTCGYIWTNGVTGYSIKYAWRAPAHEGGDRIVLVTDRRLGAQASSSPPTPDSSAERDFTVIEMRLDEEGIGEAKLSLDANIVVDAAAKTLAVDGYPSPPTPLKVTR
jgi:hypothetical protein